PLHLHDLRRPGLRPRGLLEPQGRGAGARPVGVDAAVFLPVEQDAPDVAAGFLQGNALDEEVEVAGRAELLAPAGDAPGAGVVAGEGEGRLAKGGEQVGEVAAAE